MFLKNIIFQVYICPYMGPMRKPNRDQTQSLQVFLSKSNCIDITNKVKKKKMRSYIFFVILNCFRRATMYNMLIFMFRTKAQVVLGQVQDTLSLMKNGKMNRLILLSTTNIIAFNFSHTDKSKEMFEYNIHPHNALILILSQLTSQIRLTLDVDSGLSPLSGPPF